MDLLNSVIFFLVSYLFGSFPSAYLIIKWVRNQDIRTMGTGNVGAFNVLRSTDSYFLSVLVLVLDILKGFLPAWYFTTVYQVEYSTLLIVVSGVLFGHIHPVWLRFIGGRGLAVTCGALLAFKPILIVIWMGLWGIFYLLVRRRVIATLVATLLLPLLVFFTIDWLFNYDILLMILPVSMFIFFRHLDGIIHLIKEGQLSQETKGKEK